jgi:hypothetical protein
LQKGVTAIVNAFAHANLEGANNVVITNEVLHIPGAPDQCDLGTNQPLHPDVYAEPEAQPLLPQTKAEITAGRVPLSGNQLEMPRILARYVVGAATARELHWVRSC